MSVTQAVLKAELKKLGIKTYRNRAGKRFVKKIHVLALLEVVAGALPDKDYPPANVAKMIKECENAGRSDLGSVDQSSTGLEVIAAAKKERQLLARGKMVNRRHAYDEIGLSIKVLRPVVLEAELNELGPVAESR